MSAIYTGDFDLTLEQLARVFADAGWRYGIGAGAECPDEVKLAETLGYLVTQLESGWECGETGRLRVERDDDGSVEVFLRIGRYVKADQS